MSLVKWAFIGLLILPAAELLVLLLLVSLLGWLLTIVLFFGTSVAGVLLLRRSGRGDLDRVRLEFAREGLRAIHLETPGFAAVLGGILLVLPGFITDLTGLALLIPAFRRWAGRAIGRAARSRHRDPSVIDLEPGEWHQIPDKRRKRRRKSNNEA
jgi:UPF0716 protein FxsA